MESEVESVHESFEGDEVQESSKNNEGKKRRSGNKASHTGSSSKPKRTMDLDLRYASPPWNFSWVVHGEVCGSAWPESEANIAFFKNEGVGFIVSLSEERKPHRSARHHMECHLIPVEEFEDPTMDQIDEFMDICDKARQQKKGVCVHCRMGRGRTGVMLACYLVKYYNKHPSSAITTVRLMRPGSVETREQERAVKNYWDYLAWGQLAA